MEPPSYMRSVFGPNVFIRRMTVFQIVKIQDMVLLPCNIDVARICGTLSLAKLSYILSGPGSSIGIATDCGLEIRDRIPVATSFSARPDRSWGPPNLL